MRIYVTLSIIFRLYYNEFVLYSLMKHLIEVEFRALLSQKMFNVLLRKLKKEGRLKRKSKRLSVMFFNTMKGVNYDIRVRTKGDGAEIVVKKGEYGSHRRIEFGQDILRSQCIGMVRFLSLFGFQCKVGERENTVYVLPGGSEATLVKAQSMFYIEIEKLSLPKNISKAKKEVLEWFEYFNLKPIRSEKVFLRLCKKLSRIADWNFYGEEKDFKKLERALKKY